MFVQNSLPVNNLNFESTKTDAKIPDATQPKNSIKDGKKKLALALAALGAAAIAGAAIYKGRGTKLSSIKFDKGIALSKNGDKFTGKIKDKLSNGDKIVMEYVDGVLQKSKRSGKINFEKVYETINNEQIVNKTTNGVTTKFNITKTQQEVKATQEKLKNAINSKTTAKAASETVQKTAKKIAPEAQKAETAAKTATKEAAKSVSNTGEVAKQTTKAASETVQKTAEKVSPEVQETAKTITEQAAKKLSGSAEERFKALMKNELYAKTLKGLTPDEFKTFEKLKPEILEQISDYPLSRYLNGDVEGITTTLNGVSNETLKALNDIGINTDTLVHGLTFAGKKPTAESIIEAFKRETEKYGKKFDPSKINIDKKLQRAMQRYESQFKRVKLLDKIFTPDGIKNLKGRSIDNLSIWLKGDMADSAFGHGDGQFFTSFWTALNKNAVTEKGPNMDYIMKIAEQL